jgi:hypothetical protein
MWGDADLLLSLSDQPPHSSTYNKTQLARSAGLLYVIAFEALMNRALDTFLGEQDRIDIVAKERQLSILDKLDELMNRAPMTNGRVDKSRYPWSHLKEVIDFRNDYVHPKSDRPSYLEIFAGGFCISLDHDRIPKGLTFQGRTIDRHSLFYPLTDLPRDPTRFTPNDARNIRKVVDDNFSYVDKLLDGILSKDGWHHKDTLFIVYPPGKTTSDELPPFPEELRPRISAP